MVATPNRVVVCLVLLGAVLASIGPIPASADVGVAPPTAFESAGATQDSDEHAPALVRLQGQPDTDNTITRIVLHGNGSATWTLQIRTRLETDESETEYRAFQDRFRENTSRYLGGFRESITGIVDGAREVTGREMGARDFRASTSIQTVPRRWGVVTFEFRWDGFAAVDGDRLEVGDVFEGGLFIAEGDSLAIVAPPDYRIESADPAPDESEDGVVTWHGREDFADRRPRVAFAPAGTAGIGPLPQPILLGGAALLGLVGVAVLGYRRYRRGRSEGGTFVGPSDGGPEAGATGADGGPILADEDYVHRALAEHGGRMRQKAIAEDLDWSRSKTSRVLRRMAEDGRVEKLQLGRENVIALPEEADVSEE